VKAIAAIALLALRNAMRSRVILVLFLLLLAAGFLLPLSVRSDGTPDGLIRIHLAYTLGIASFLLTLSTLWAGCASLSQEAEEKTLQLLIVKPVPRLSIWLGKWCALLLINAGLLTLVGVTSALTLQIQLHRADFEAEALNQARQTTLASLQTLHAPLPDIEADVQAEMKALRERQALPPELSQEALRSSVHRTLLAKQFAVPPSEAHRWEFPLPPPDRKPSELLVRYSCDSSVPGGADIHATLTLQAGGQSFSRDLLAMPGVPQTILFSTLPPDATAATVTLINHGTHQATLFFDPSDGMVLRQPMGTFAGNYLRALAQLYLRLALFAAIGVTLGTLFSMPVASFITLVLLLVLQLSAFVTAAAQTDRADFVATLAPFGAAAHAHGDAGEASPPPSLLARGTANLLYYAYRGTYVTLRPLLEDQSLEDLSTGTRIPPREVLRNGLQQGLLLPLLLALFSTLILRRREWALPAQN
jgi:ABC-2 family transporter protein